jgi:gliding motility-associated-like protein
LKQNLGIFYVILGLIFGLSNNANAQGTSNKGTDFWVAYAGHIDNKTSRMTLFLSSDVTTTYKVEGAGQVIESGTITANVIKSVFINPNTVDVYVGSSDVVENNKGIHVTSGNPISVYAIISNSARTGGSLILPTRALGKEYYAFSFQNEGGQLAAGARSEFTIIAVEDGTEVEITPTVTSLSGARIAGSTFKIPVKLNKGDVYQYQSPNDVSGTLIKTLGSCKPLAVFSGSTWTAFCDAGNIYTNPNTPLPGRPLPSGGDNLYQQLFPVSAWGKNFVTAPFYNTENGNIDAIRIIVSEDNTNITVNGSATNASGTPLSNPYGKGSIITYFTNSPSIVKADKPIGVAQYQTAQNCNPSNRPTAIFPGDPEMTVLNPIEQTLSDITVFSRLNSVPGVNTNITKYFLNIILKTADAASLRVNGAAVSGFKTIDSEYSYVIIDVTNSSDQHRIVAKGGFVAIAYGYGNVESYAYLAGADVKNLFQNITVNDKANNVLTSGCVSQPSKFVLKLPYETTEIVWDLDDGTGPFTDSAPTFTTSLIDGKVVYIYAYPKADPIYATPRKYKITAVVVNPNPSGCSNLETIDLDFEVFAPPTALYTSPPEVCTNAPISFTDASIGNGKAIKGWKWDFGDGNTSILKNPSHTFLAAGDYDVKLIVEGETGCESDVFTQTIRVLELPKVDFKTSNPTCVSRDITFTDQSTTAEGKITKWTWDFGDGTSPVEKTDATPFLYNYSNIGNYKVILKVLTDKGCESLPFEMNVIINPLPVVDFKLPEVCIKDEFAEFADLSTISDGSALTYYWDFGNPSTGALNNSTLKNPKHKYTIAGDYTASLTVTSAAGCSVSLQKKFQVSGAVPKADFEVLNSSDLCSNREVVFKNTSTVDFGNIVKIIWFFDDGGDMTFTMEDDSPVPNKEYRISYPLFSSPATKKFKVRMLAYSGGICFDSIIQEIELKSVPEVVFSALSDVCQEVPPFKLTQASEKNGQIGIGVYSGNGVSANGIFSPALAGIGKHTINYVFTTTNGCSDSLSQDILVMPTPTLSAGKDTVMLEGGEIKLYATASGSNLTYKWLPSVGLSRDDILDPIATPVDDITYILTARSDQGCVALDEIKVKVLKAPVVPNAFSPNGDGVNDTWNIQYLESYANTTIKIFNRYGAIVYYSAKGYAKHWDGQFNGTDLPAGVYYYIIDPKTKGRSLITGNVTIIR